MVRTVRSPVAYLNTVRSPLFYCVIDKRGAHISTLYHHSIHHFFLLNLLPFPVLHFLLTTDMSDQSGSSYLQVLLEAALHDYEMQTGIELAKHPLAEQLQSCDSVESVSAVLCDQTQAFGEFRENDKVLKPLKKAVSVLYKLSATANFGQDIGLVRS